MKAVDDAGNEDETSAERHWTVDTTAPAVLDPVSPTGKKVSPKANVIATFSEAMHETSVEVKDPSGTPTTVTLIKKGTTTPVAATVTYDATTRKVTLDPSANLKRGAIYTATTTTAAKDEAGNALAANKTWSFRVRR